jgi:hypothetical protein
MKTTRRVLTSLVLLPVLLMPGPARSAAPSQEPKGEVRPPVRSPTQIEADWLRQEVVRNLPSGHNLPVVTPEQDAPGACDGVRNGKYGFHTNLDESPWWQVDLLAPVPLEEVLIFNRSDGSENRALKLKVLLSDDAETWKSVYQHDGAPFLGHKDNKPLAVRLEKVKARYLRIQLPDKTYLHLDEVEIYQPGGRRNIALRKPATQSSASPWSTKSTMVSIADAASKDPAETATPEPTYPVEQVVERGLALAESLRKLGSEVEAEAETLREIAGQIGEQVEGFSAERKKELYFRARWAVRKMAFQNPLLDFDDLLLVKRTPARFTTSPESRTYTQLSDL